MKTRLILSIVATGLIALGGPVWAQDKRIDQQPPAKQSAPAESPEASGQDAQTGKPETGEDKDKAGAKKDTGKKGSAQTNKN